MDAMFSRITRLKQITIDIHDDVHSQNQELDGMVGFR
jgi:hypothetical protein